jgi:hypothetical protein
MDVAGSQDLTLRDKAVRRVLCRLRTTLGGIRLLPFVAESEKVLGKIRGLL